MNDGLRSVTSRELRAALDRLAEEGIEQVEAHRMHTWGMRALAESIHPLGTIETRLLRMVIQCVLAERSSPRAQVDLVWTGPHPRVSTARDTYVVVRDLFKDARSEVIVAGYRFDHGEELLEPLHARARDGVRVVIFMDVDEKARSDDAVEGLATKAGQAFLDKNWTFGAPFPELYFDYRAVAPGPYANMHAKCVVVDNHWALVGSANFTSQGQKQNVEVGVRIEDPRFARELAGHWWAGVWEKAFRLIEIPEGSTDSSTD